MNREIEIPKGYEARINGNKVILEPKDSEDERIRKELWEYFHELELKSDRDFSPSFTIDDILAWLEKQKDLDKMIVVSPEVWDKAIADAYENGKKDNEKQKEPHYTKRNALFDKCVENCDPEIMQRVSDEVDEMLGKEQKPTEWSKEDERRLCNLIARCIALGKQKGWVNDDDEVACLNIISRKDTSWSREDEVMLKLIISELEQEGEDVNVPKLYHKEIAWLKSLRPPQYCENCKLKRSVENWNPSEEQMEALDKALYYVPEEIGIPIAEIYGHFNKMKKKLM